MSSVPVRRHDAPSTLSAGGEMGARIRAHDWSGTPLGPIGTWPAVLRSSLNLMLNSPESMYLVWGADLTFFFNDAYRPILGSRLGEALGRPMRELWPDAWDKVRGPLEKALKGEASRFEDVPIAMARHGKEEETWWSYSYSPLIGEDGGIAGVFCLTNETTTRVLSERRRAEALEALRDSEARLRAMNTTLEGLVADRTAEIRLYRDIIRSNADPICAFDDEFRLIAFNQAHSDEFHRIFGFRPQLGDVFPEILPPDQGVVMRGLMARALSGESYTIEEQFGDDGLVKPYWELTYTPMRDEDGRIVGAFHYAKDITGRLRAEAELAATQEALRQSQKMEAVGQLTGGVAHDFNNLLTIIRSSVDFLRRSELPEARRQRYVEAVSDTVDRAARLTGQLLAFARRQVLKPELFEVGAKLRGVGEMLDTVTGARIHVVLEVPEDPCFVRADLSQFETAIVNMVVNARDAMDGQGRLTLRLDASAPMPRIRGHAGSRGRFAAISVTDTGSGIPPDQLTRIFEPFFTTKGVGKGTGLGLSQVFGFAKQSGGDVDVRSAVGEGATFTLYLPEEQAEPAVAEESAAEFLPDAGGTGQCILVVEDNLEVGRFCTQLLADLGYRTTWAIHAEEALLKLGTDGAGFDVVFSDVVMPGMGGVALAEILRDRLPHLPVVLTSGYSHVLAREANHGFELLHKPYSAEQLGRVLQGVIARAATQK